MYDTILSLDFNKLRFYFPDINDTQISQIEKAGGINLTLDYMSHEDFVRFSEGFKRMCNEYNLQDHYYELMYFILQKNEQILNRLEMYWRNYEDDQTSSELATFLLTYLSSEPDDDLRISISTSKTKNVALKNTRLTKWMCTQIYNAVVARDVSLAEVGEKVEYNLFGDDAYSPNPLSIARLEAAAILNPKKPNYRSKALQIELCLCIRGYLINETCLTAPPEVLLTDAQANFFFEVLELLDYLKKDKIGSVPKDYMRTMFKANIRLIDRASGK